MVAPEAITQRANRSEDPLRPLLPQVRWGQGRRRRRWIDPPRRLPIIIRRHGADEPALRRVRREARRRPHIPVHARFIQRIGLRPQDAPLDGQGVRRQRVRFLRSLRVRAPILKSRESQPIHWRPRGVHRFPRAFEGRPFLRHARPSAAPRLESAPHRRLRLAREPRTRHPRDHNRFLVPHAQRVVPCARTRIHFPFAAGNDLRLRVQRAQ